MTLNTLGSILVHVDASPRTTLRLQMALKLAALSADKATSTVTAAYATVPAFVEVPFAYAEIAAGAMAVVQELEVQRRTDAKKLFDQVNATAAPPMRWLELNNDPLIPAMTHQALMADLMVLGQYEAQDTLSIGTPSNFVESVVIASGKPALIVPFVGSFDTVGKQRADRVEIHPRVSPSVERCCAPASTRKVHPLGVGSRQPTQPID